MTPLRTLQQHRIAQNGTICCMCNNVDDNVHKLKHCRGSGVIWSWLTRTLKHILRLDFDDLEELFSRRLTLVKEAGLWYVAAAVHYNINNYENSTVEAFKDMTRRMRGEKNMCLRNTTENYCMYVL
jgi:hypothetical protein